MTQTRTDEVALPEESIEKYKAEVTVEDDIVVFKDDGSVLKSTDYETSTFFNGYASPTNVANEFSVSYAGVGTITATFDLTSNSKTPKTDSYDLFSARGYTVTIWLTDEDTTTNITADCTFFAYDGKTYVVDSTTGQLLLVIHDAYIENDVTPPA